VRVLGAENGVEAGCPGLDAQGLHIVSRSHEVGLRRKFVRGMPPVGIGKRPQLAAFHKGSQPLLDGFEIDGASHLGVAHIIGERGRGLGISLQGAHHVHPVQGVQMIKVDEMIVLELGAVEEIADDSGVVGNFYLDRIFDCPHRGQGMGQRSDPAGALDKMMGIPGIPAQKDQFDSAKHLAAAPGIDDFAAGDFHFNSQVPFYSCDRIDGDSFSHKTFSFILLENRMAFGLRHPFTFPGKTVSSYPKSRVRCTRCTDARLRWGSWCLR